MRAKNLQYYGLVFLISGVFLLLLSSSGITGLAIFDVGFDDIQKVVFSYIGMVFFLFGIAMIFVSDFTQQIRNREGHLLTVIRTKRFEKAIRGHNPQEIQRALDKIGTSLGHEKKLSHLPGYSIKTSKGGRIMYEKDSGDVVRVTDYTPDHHYA